MATKFTERQLQIDRAGYEAWNEYQRTHNGDTPDHSERFTWEKQQPVPVLTNVATNISSQYGIHIPAHSVTGTQAANAVTEQQFRQQVKSDVERILHAFTFEEHIQITFVPLVLNEIAWQLALKAIALGARDKVQDLRKLSRVLRQLREHYERVVYKDLQPSDFKRLQVQSLEFMQEYAYHFQIMYYTASNVFSKQYGRLPFEEMRVYALLAMLVIRYTDEHNKRCDEMLKARLGAIHAAKRMPDMDSLYSGMEAYTGELPQPFNFSDTNLQMCVGILRNNLLKTQWVIINSHD